MAIDIYDPEAAFKWAVRCAARSGDLQKVGFSLAAILNADGFNADAVAAIGISIIAAAAASSEAEQKQTALS